MHYNRVKELDSLRGIAALMVIFYHYTFNRPQADLGFNLGTTGVELFFMISGFVIFMSLNKVKSSLQFIVNRISRLYPTYWVCVTFTFIVISIYSIISLSQLDIISYLGNLTMFQFYLNIADIDDSYWTMIIEMTFYIAMLALFHFKKLRYLNLIGLTLITIVTIIGVFFYDATIVKNIFNWVKFLLYAPLFLSGIVFYKLYHQKEKIIANYSILLVCLIAQILSFNYSERFFYANNQIQYSIMLAIYYLLFTLIVHRKLAFITSNMTLFFGKISFALYLIHQAFSVKIIIPYFMNQLHFSFWVTTLVFALPIIIIIATLITYFIEIPVGKLIRQKMFAKKLAAL